MADTPYLTYQTFTNSADAQELLDLLQTHGIDATVEDTSAYFDPSFANNPVSREYRVKLRHDAFPQADALLLHAAAEQLDAVPPDYYLFQFSDEELHEVVAKRDEWGQLDYLLAQKILRERGQGLDPAALEALQQQRLETLARPDRSQTGWIPAGYALALLGGVLGILVGWHLHTSRKTLPNGEQVYSYPAADRRHGKRIAVLGVASLAVWTVYKLWRGDTTPFFHL